MGDFEIFVFVLSNISLSFVIYNALNSFMFSNLVQRFGSFNISRRDFYECGFSPVTQNPISIPLPFLLICIFFLLYDIELIYLFPLLSYTTSLILTDLYLLLLFLLLLFISLAFDFNNHSFYWQY